MSDNDENPNPPTPVPPAEGVPPAQYPVPPAEAMPVPPAQQPIPPAGPMPVPPAHQPVPPAPLPGGQPIPPVDPNQVPGFDTVQLQPQQPPIQPPAINAGPAIPPINPAAGGAPATPAGRRPATGGRRPAGKKKVARKKSAKPGYKRPPADSGFSFMSVLMALLGIGILAVSVIALLPKPLVHINGYPTDKLSSKEPKNLLAAGQAILETREGDVTFSEKEVNDYINFRLQGNQKGALGGIMKVKGIYIDLRPKEAEIFVERSFPLIGTTTISSIVKSQYNDIKHQQFWKLGGGSIGRFTIKERSLQPVLNVFIRMGRVGGAELEVMNYMADVKIGEDKITLKSSL